MKPAVPETLGSEAVSSIPQLISRVAFAAIGRLKTCHR